MLTDPSCDETGLDVEVNEVRCAEHEILAHGQLFKRCELVSIANTDGENDNSLVSQLLNGSIE